MPGYNDAVEIDEVDLRKDLPINITMKGFKLNKNQHFRPFSGSRLAEQRNVSLLGPYSNEAPPRIRSGKL